MKRFGLLGWLASVAIAACLVAGMGYALTPATDGTAKAKPARASALSEPVAPSPSAPESPVLMIRERTAPVATLSPRPTPTEKPRERKPRERKPTAPAPPATVELVISSFNALGSQHTERGGHRAGMASGVTRTRWAVEVLARHGVDVVGFQELRSDQMAEFQRIASGTYDVYPGFRLGKRETVNSIAWRKDTWRLVTPDTVAVPYFRGEWRPKPVVLLEHRATGLRAYFANFHNPASIAKHGNQERWRDVATATQVKLANRIAATGLPLFITGDMNERDEYFCKLTGGAPMVAANGGSNAGGCRPPHPMNVDWIFGSRDVRFTSFTADRSPLVNRTTDHPVIVARARFEGRSSAVSEAQEALSNAEESLPQ